MSIKTAKKNKDKLLSELTHIKAEFITNCKIVEDVHNYVDKIGSDVEFIKENIDVLSDMKSTIEILEIKEEGHKNSLKLYSQHLADVKMKGDLEARHSFMIGIMAGAMGVMVLLILISIFA